MPELPEVEVVRRQLARVIEGRRITRVWAAAPNYFFVTAPRTLTMRLRDRTIERLVRVGKYLLFELDDRSRLLGHLGMTGQITTRPLERDPHVHLVLDLGKKGARGSEVKLTFRDVRKFGKVEWIAPGRTSKRLEKLGPDALELDGTALGRALGKRMVPVKTALLNQSITAGIGNIYADEALFIAGVRPTRIASKVKPAEALAIASAVRSLLRTSVEQGGSTINDYIQPDGELGGFQDFHRVYGKTAEPCSTCAAPIQRVVLGGRSSHYCPSCQR